MPIPCTSFNPLSPGPAVGTSPLQAADPSLTASVGSAPKDRSASFDRLLSDEDKPDASPDEMAQPPPSLAPAAVTPEQLAMLASMVMPNPALLPPPPPQVQPDSTAVDSSFQLVGAEGRSIPELLARGTATLDYQMAGPSSSAAAPTTTKVVSVAKSSEEFTAATLPDPLQRSLSAPLSPVPQALADLPTAEPVSPNPSSALPPPSTPPKVDGTAAGVTPDSSVFTVNRLWKDRPFRLRETSPVALPAKDTPPLSPLVSSTSPSAPEASISPGTPLTPVPPPSSPAPTADPSASTDSQSSPIDSSAATNTTVVVPPSAPLAKALTEGAAANSPKGKGAPSERREKSAGSLDAIRSAGGKSPSVRGKNVGLPVDSEAVENPSIEVGTVAANWGKLMDPESRNLPAATRQNDPASFGSLVRSEAGTTAASDVKTIAPSHATDLVHEIKDIADGLWSVERNSVEVKFNFSEQERLSVKVEYRDGTVQATFRSDSADVRDAIAREWQAQASSPTEQRPYRVAEPIFTGSAPATGSSFGGDASRQQRSPEQAQTTTFDRLPLGGNSRSAPSTTSSLAPSPLHRETPGRLHAFV